MLGRSTAGNVGLLGGVRVHGLALAGVSRVCGIDVDRCECSPETSVETFCDTTFLETLSGMRLTALKLLLCVTRPTFLLYLLTYYCYLLTCCAVRRQKRLLL